MNKQELIEYCKYLKGDLNKFINRIDVNKIIAKIEQLDEPQKLVVPQFVADWIEHTKKENYHIFGAIQATESDDMLDDWMWCDDNMEIFARAWLDGYTIEKEPKYTVKCKTTKQYLSNDELGPHFDPSFRSNFTKSDLEKLGLGWVFDCEGIELEEVEE